MEMKLQVVTIAVRSLDRARAFYEGVLGFEPAIYYEPTRWQSYRVDGEGSFAVIEKKDLDRSPTSDIVNLTVSDVQGLWTRVKDFVEVEVRTRDDALGGLQVRHPRCRWLSHRLRRFADMTD
jgi:catechol 2,3-dioxygenase-like lactoylglutathione lyase family enzyme